MANGLQDFQSVSGFKHIISHNVCLHVPTKETLLIDKLIDFMFPNTI